MPGRLKDSLRQSRDAEFDKQGISGKIKKGVYGAIDTAGDAYDWATGESPTVKADREHEQKKKAVETGIGAAIGNVAGGIVGLAASRYKPLKAIGSGAKAVRNYISKRMNEQSGFLGFSRPADYVDRFDPDVAKDPKKKYQYKRARREKTAIYRQHTSFNKSHFGVPEE